MRKIFPLALFQEILPYVFVTIAIVAAIILAVYLISPQQKPEKVGRRELNDFFQMLLNRLNTKTATIESEVNIVASKAEAALNGVDELQKSVEEQKEQSNILRGGIEQALRGQTIIARTLAKLDQKVLDLIAGQDRARKHLRQLSEGYRDLLPETEKPISPLVTPINQEVAVARLTPTEMLILRTLSSSGAKTASEIKEIIGKTREHSARLMKKLYLGGYIERDTSSLPYGYKLSEKIRKSYEFSSEGTSIDPNR